MAIGNTNGATITRRPGWFHELPAKQQDDVDDDKEHDRAKAGGQHGLGDRLGNLFFG